MAAQTAVNPLKAMAGKFREGFKKTKAEPPTVGQGDLPEISNGVARLVDCKVTTIAKGKQNAGQLMFYAAGVVVKPLDVGGVPVRGKRTQISEPLHATPNRKLQTAQEHFDKVCNILKCLGVDMSEFSEETYMDEIIEAMAQLTKEKPYFEFRTWKGSKQEIEQGSDGKWYVGDKKYATKELAAKANPFAGKEPRINHDWGMAIEGFSEDETGDDGDNTGGDTPDPETMAEEPSNDEQQGEATAAGDDFDVDAVLALCNQDGGDEDAQTAIRARATELGATKEWLDSDDTSWDMIADHIRENGQVADEPAADPEPEPEKWEKGKVTVYPKKDAKGKPVLNAKKKPIMIECELVSFDSKTKSWKVKSLDDGKTMTMVKEADLKAPG